MPVISVGNLSWGGNGKTPMVEFIAKWLLHSGVSPLILTRVFTYSLFFPFHFPTYYLSRRRTYYL